MTLSGTFQISEVFDILARQREDGTWGYGLFVDIRFMTGAPALADLRRIAVEDAQPGPDGQQRGPVAVLVTSAILYGLACAYQSLTRSRRALDVFRGRAEAEAWLADQTASYV